jgi:hypothetical protein
MRWLALGSLVFLMGAWFGFYEAHAASGIKYDGFLVSKEASKKSDAFLNGYVAGMYDQLSTVAYLANERPEVFTAATFNRPFLCLQKAQNTSEIVAFAKDFWSKQPDVWAVDVVFVRACEFSASARANTMTRTAGGVSRGQGGAHSLTGGK